ncbi:AAA family ATPase [Hoeflea sp. Naph1]|uniref:bifunctional aminoglycoside phosphotransferase/ATP-binding protein n=1 Tax=Hoeflea sp. Naph1 TaxID=3388653 RepID=UPI00398F97E8
MSEQCQSEVIAFLSDGMNLPGRAPVEVIRTHGAVVFLSGSDAYKIKRDVRYDYLDFSTLQKRHDMLVRELDLNRPTAPSIYRDVIAVTRDSGGALHLGGAGEVVEWVLRMHRFDAADELNKVAERGGLDDRMAVTLGESIAQYHDSTLPRTQISGSDLIDAILDELNAAFATMIGDLGADNVEKFRSDSDHVFRKIRATLDSRGTHGHVRRCHGDLHLRNIVLVDGVPTPFDALEFDETLGTCDVLYDLAFLLMDLRYKGLARAANIVLNSYLAHSGSMGNYEGLSVLQLFLSIRAAIRAMVAVQTARFNPDDDTLVPEARRYLSSALAYLHPEPVQMIAIGGLSGTGKTVLATSLAHQIGLAPGAVHLRSDLERKALFGVSPLTHLPQSAYGSEVNARVYDIMRDKARAVLRGGHSVIMDATWLNQDERTSLSDLARQEGVQFTGIWLIADTAVLETRVSSRRGDASDADVAVVRKQATQTNAPEAWRQIDASGSPDDTLFKAARLLFGSGKPETAGHE